MSVYDIWLANAKLSNRIKIELVKKFKTSQKIWYYLIDNYYPLNNNIKEKLTEAWNSKNIEAITKLIDKYKIRTVTYFDEDYPNALRNYPDAPFILFYKGNISSVNKNRCVSVVGARNCSAYGMQATKYIVRELCKNNISIISGMAKGIDSYAHTTCLESGGYTLAVFGCGVDVIYPKVNKNLYYSILNNGCAISEFLPGTKPYSYNFPLRNRIISGLSELVIVVEAGEKSGTLITANCALEQGKDIIAVPGSIFSPQSKGTIKLISEGAYPFTNMNDVFSLMGMHSLGNLNNFAKGNNRSKVGKTNILYNKILELITDDPIHVDDIVRISNIDIKQLYDVLFEMQFNNEIMCLSGNYYVKVHNI